MLRITPLIGALLDVIPIWPDRGHLQPFRLFALMHLTDRCPHVLHEVSVHPSAPPLPQRGADMRLSVSIESPLSLTGSSSSAASLAGRKVKVWGCEGLFLQVPANSDPFFCALWLTLRGSEHWYTQSYRYCSCAKWGGGASFKNKITHVYLFYMQALRKLDFPNSRFLELINFIIVWRLRETRVQNHLWLTPACDFTALLILYTPAGSEKNTVICSYSHGCVSQPLLSHNQTQAPLLHQIWPPRNEWCVLRCAVAGSLLENGSVFLKLHKGVTRWTAILADRMEQLFRHLTLL